MLGIKQIASYLPNKKISNYDKKDKFNLDDDFIENKIGVKYHTIKEDDEKASDLCIKAYANLIHKLDIDKNNIDCVIVITQNPDFNIPHTSAIVHGKLKLSQNCACFDISLGCSGYIYGLSNILSFMQVNGLNHGLLFTADPYSEIINHEDKNTDLIFGDGATVTYISHNSLYIPKSFMFGTNGSAYKEILCDETLYMNGRAVFSFTATTIPKHIKSILENNNLEDKDIDKYILHQGSKYIVDTIRKRLKISKNKVPFDMYEYGNTVSSAVPLILEKELYKDNNQKMVLCAYGIGLSWGSAILEKIKDYNESNN
jgi:3-oxoacyl-[acyl-carrier-protein] synthase-3